MAPKQNTFPLTGSIGVHARLAHGRITVNAVDDCTEATVTFGGPDDLVERMTVELRGSTLEVTAPRQGGIFDLFGGRRRERDGIDVEVTVPTGTTLKIATFTADVIVRGTCGTADVATGAADLTIEHVAGDLRVRHGSGGCDVGEVDGSATIRTGSGDSRLGPVRGSLQAGCGSGQLEVASVGGAVHSRAGAGSAMIGAVFGDVDLASGSGTLQIGLPEGFSTRLDVTTGSGRVESELPIVNTPRTESRVITVRARTGSGNIRLFRAA